MNEQMILSLEDVAQLFENRFNIPMLCNLEKHILALNNFRINVATPLDFTLHFTIMEADILKMNIGCIELEPELILNDAVSLLHYSMSQYDISRKKYSSIAVATICAVLQDIHDQFKLEMDDHSQGPMDESNISQLQKVRDDFLNSLFQKYPQLDQDEIFEILQKLRDPHVQLIKQHDADMAEECLAWSFSRLLINQRGDDDFEMCDMNTIHRESAMVELGLHE